MRSKERVSMGKTIEQIANEIDAIIAARKKRLPGIQTERTRVQYQVAALSTITQQLDELISTCSDEVIRTEAKDALHRLDDFVSRLNGYVASLGELEAEFTRDTLNIGVSGAARTGKSTTLQRITGLTDQQIPSGGLNPVTAVRSEIFNSSRNEAVITFKTRQAFVEEYLRPHVDNVNACLPEGDCICISSVNDLKNAELPAKLQGGSVPVAATDSLKRLREAQRSASTYESLLGAPPRTVSLNDVRYYITYPTADAEAIENEGRACDRRYLAVELAQVFCQFPNLGSAKVALVDLPGLGEIGNAANAVHLKGLESKVDQIFLVMRPTAAKAFTDAEVGCNLDQLNAIQPAVRRGDLVVAGINKDQQAGQQAADNLRSHFDAEINAGRSDCYSLVEYCAVDQEDTARMFGILLDRLGGLLPSMDKTKLDYCMGRVDLSAQVASAMEQLVRAMDRVLRSVPSSDRVMKRRIDSIERAIVGGLNAYAVELSEASVAESQVFQNFVADAERIHDETALRIENGLFRDNNEEWDELTSSSRDYYNLYRDEDKRIRYEIIDAYCGLDSFYGVHVSSFKLRVLDTVLRACGMDRFFGFTDDDTADQRISKVASELGATLRDDDLDNALRLLAGVNFDFRSNVFLQIEGYLAELANPSQDELGRHGDNKREVLGGEGSSQYKQEKLRKYLHNDATEANDNILDALKTEEDRFNEYLAVSIDFFNNALFGKDEDNFKQVVIRGLIREYKEYILPDADDASMSPVGAVAKSIKESAQAIQRGQYPVAASSPDCRDADHLQPEERPAADNAPASVEIYPGKVKHKKPAGAVINFGEKDGWAYFENIPNAKHGSLGLEEGQSVKVRVLGQNDEGRIDLEVVS